MGWDYEDSDIGRDNESWGDLNSFQIVRPKPKHRGPCTDIYGNPVDPSALDFLLGGMCAAKSNYGAKTRKTRCPGPRGRRLGTPEWALNPKRLALHILTPALRQWAVAHMYWYQGDETPEIAARLHITNGAVKQIIRRLRKAAVKRVQQRTRAAKARTAELDSRFQTTETRQERTRSGTIT